MYSNGSSVFMTSVEPSIMNGIISKVGIHMGVPFAGDNKLHFSSLQLVLNTRQLLSCHCKASIVKNTNKLWFVIYDEDE